MGSQEAGPERFAFQRGGGVAPQAAGAGGEPTLGLEEGPERQFGSQFGTKSFICYPVGISKLLAVVF